MRPGRPWGLPLEDRPALVAVYWRTNVTLRRLAPMFGVLEWAADGIINRLGPLLALQPRRRFREDTVPNRGWHLGATHDHAVAEQSKNYWYSHRPPGRRR